MEENNKKGPGVFYAVVGVATLLVAIIGATFAYFSASAKGDTTTIQGGTNDDVGGALSVTVSRLPLNPSPAPASDSLVPAVFTNKTPTTIDAASVNAALTAKCVNGGYTGCHVWKIVASTTQTVANANLKLHLELDNAIEDKAQWSYVVYTGTDSAASNIVDKNSIPTTFNEEGKTIDIHSNAELAKNSPATYYVMIYLNNEDNSQNTSGDTNDATGSYSGTVALEAMGGEVKTTFTASA